MMERSRSALAGCASGMVDCAGKSSFSLDLKSFKNAQLLLLLSVIS